MLSVSFFDNGLIVPVIKTKQTQGYYLQLVDAI